MAGLTDHTARALLDTLFKGATFPAAAAPHLGLLTTIGTDAGSQVEAAYTSYARVSIASIMASATGSAPATITNSDTISWPTCTNSGGGVIETVVGWGLWDASTAGTSALDILTTFSAAGRAFTGGLARLSSRVSIVPDPSRTGHVVTDARSVTVLSVSRVGYASATARAVTP